MKKDDNQDNFSHILKPYVYYTMRYIQGNYDFVVNYSLDNYMTIYGTIVEDGKRKICNEIWLSFTSKWWQ